MGNPIYKWCFPFFNKWQLGDLAYLKTVFDSVDEDGGGTIDKDEYTSETKG